MAETDKQSLKKELGRRQVLQWGLASAGALLVSNLGQAATCGPTPRQAEGPFYPGEDQFSTTNDLTKLPGLAGQAEGQVIYVQGRVLDHQCQPIPRANVEIWQANTHGRYNHSQDPNPAPIDPHFKYWGETFTNEKGEYFFKTILPGAYPAGDGWNRPPHIHFKVSRLGYDDLITQMYFKGQPLNHQDLILRRIPTSERQKVVVDFQPAPLNSDRNFAAGSLVGTFDIYLGKVM